MQKVAIFDLDGTLLDTVADLAWSVNTALAEFGYSTHPVSAYYYFVGNGAHNLIRRALPQNAPDEVFRAVYARYSALYESHWNVSTQPYDGIPALLTALRAQGIKLGVVSNKIHERTQEVIRTYFPDTFDVVLGNRPDVPLKPDPAALHEAIAALGSDAAHTWYLGDTAVDVETGKNAGVYTVGAEWGFRDAEELWSAGADAVCGTSAEALGNAEAFFAKK